MSVDGKQFNRSTYTYEDIECHIRRAKWLRSEAMAHSARRWATAVGAGVRHLRDIVGNGLRGEAGNGTRASHLRSPVTSTHGQAAHCK